MIYDNQNAEFAIAVKFVNHTNASFFLTGKAGTGKTTFLKFVKQNSTKNSIVVAPTGVAAVNAGGVTIHSFFQLPFAYYLPQADFFSHRNNDKFITTEGLLNRIKFNPLKKKLIEALDTIIVDEVSMVRADMIDAMDTILRHVRKRPHQPFGGIQMVFIGDLFQLPPILETDCIRTYYEHYRSPFFFDSLALKENSLLSIELLKIYRQRDNDFIEILNNIRHNTVQPEHLEVINARLSEDFIPDPEDPYITLTTHNYRADVMNNRALAGLPTESHVFAGTLTGDYNSKNLPADLQLKLKEGAQVMFIKNDSGEQRKYYNGKLGTVTRIHNGNIYVKPGGEQEEMKVEKEVWTNIRYVLQPETGKIKEEVTGSYTQYPLRLAWSITIHKSQGLTFEKAIIDAGNAFAPGQVYVALSRLTGLNGLILKTEVLPSGILTDERVVAFGESATGKADLQIILKEQQEEYFKEYHLRKLNPAGIMKEASAFNTVLLKKKDAFSRQLVFILYDILAVLSEIKQSYKVLFGSDHTHNNLNLPESAVEDTLNYYKERITTLTNDLKAIGNLHKVPVSVNKKYLLLIQMMENYCQCIEMGIKIKTEGAIQFNSL